ncbi:MAG: hypothetical protein H0U54_13625, partial [Acidobacteria bacterium]|nr:hypothetical protein [Acidobacteriota bacterium]
NKRSLLSGDRATPIPDPGSLKSEQPEIKSTAPAPRRSRVMADPMPAPAPIISAPAQPPPPRNTIEMIQGGKKSSVDFP